MSDFEFNDAFFDEVLNSQEMAALTREAAERIATTAKATAPVDTGAYRDGITTATRKVGDRTSSFAEATDPKSILIEARTGNMARALRANRQSG